MNHNEATLGFWPPRRSWRPPHSAAVILILALSFAAVRSLGAGASVPSAPAAARAVLPARPIVGPVERLPLAFGRATPTSVEDLRAIERHVKALVPRVSPAVVAVQVRSAVGTGVVISEDGLVLTAAHVCSDPGREVEFTFPDGRKAHGKTLGTDHEMDSGLMKITDKGRWPHVAIGSFVQAQLGDWVLTLGHPGGFEAQRPVVARLGRVISLTADAVRTDCTLMAGDSGGPLFDMHGRVLAIHSRISDSTTENFHVPIKTFEDTWERLVQSESWGRPQRPWLGTRGSDHADGCELERVDETGPAFKAGVKTGDIVTKVNGKLVANAETYSQIVRASKPGDELTLNLKREGRELEIKVKVATRPSRD